VPREREIEALLRSSCLMSSAERPHAPYETHQCHRTVRTCQERPLAARFISLRPEGRSYERPKIFSAHFNTTA